MEIRNVKLSKLIHYEKNTKKHDDAQINNVAESIRKFGFVQPIVIDKDNVIVIGHCRALAAQRLNLAEVPCILVDNLTPAQVDALRVVDNKTNESPWDIDLLWDILPELDLEGFDFDFEEPNQGDIDSFFDDGPAPKKEAEPKRIDVTCPCCGEKFEWVIQ